MSILAIYTLGLFVFAYEQQQRNTATAIRGNLTVTHSNCQKIMKYLCGGGKTYCNLHVFHLRIDVLNFRNCRAFMVGLCIFTGHRCLCMTPVILKQE